MKKITFFINSLEIGGTEKQLLQLIKELKNRFSIDIFCFRKGKLYNDFLKQKVNIITGNNSFFSFWVLVYYLLKNQNDIYHFFLPKTYIICSFLTIFSKKKKIMSRRSLNFYHTKYFKVSLYIEKFLHKYVDRIVCNTFKIKKQLIYDEGVDKKKITLIKNFFIPFSKLKKKKKIKKFKNRVSFAYVANLISYKGHEQLIDICSKLKTKKKWTLYLAGDGSKEYLNKLRNLVKERRLENRIIFLGLIKDVYSLYQDMDFIINTSLEEGSSNTLLEALSMKLPIICFDIGGNKDFFNNNGFLVKYKDYENLKKKLCILIDSNKKKELGENSFKYFRKKFDNKSVLNQHLKLYN